MSTDDSPTDQAADPDVPSADDAHSEDDQQAASESGDRSGRDVVVPMRVYKAVTVFTTLFAVATVVGGFVLLDTATNRAQADLADVEPLLALLGIGLIVVGAAAYAFSTRFRAAGMGKSKDDTDEVSDNG